MSGVFAKFVRGIEGMKSIFLHQFSVARLGFELTRQFGCFFTSFLSLASELGLEANFSH
jgi:hypothetical protein